MDVGSFVRRRLTTILLAVVAVLVVVNAALLVVMVRSTHRYSVTERPTVVSTVVAMPSPTGFVKLRTVPGWITTSADPIFASVRAIDLTEWHQTDNPSEYWTDSTGAPRLLAVDALRGMSDYHPGLLMCLVPAGTTVAEIQVVARRVSGRIVHGPTGTVVTGVKFQSLVFTCQLVIGTSSIMG